MSPYRICTGIVLALVVLELVKKKQADIPNELLLFLLFLIGTSLIGINTRNLSVYIQYLFLSCLAVIIYNLLKIVQLRQRDFNILMYLLIVIGCIGGLTLLTDYYQLTQFSLLFGKEIYKESLSGRGAGLLGGEANLTAARLVALLPFGLYLLFSSKKWGINKIVVFFMASIILFAIILTGSRMGILALCQIILFTMIYEMRKAKLGMRISLVVGFIGLITVLFLSFGLIKDKKSQSRFESLGSITDLNKISYTNYDMDESLVERFLLMWVGVDLIRKNPIWGIGIGNAKYMPQKYLPTIDKIKYLHNTYLDVGSENGIPMLLILIMFLGWILVSLFKKRTHIEHDFYFYFSLGFWILMFCWFFLSDFSNKLFWNLFLPLAMYLIKKPNPEVTFD